MTTANEIKVNKRFMRLILFALICCCIDACSKKNKESTDSQNKAAQTTVKNVASNLTVEGVLDSVVDSSFDSDLVKTLVATFNSDALLTSAWRTLPYEQRVVLGSAKLKLLSEKEKSAFANWCMWHDPRIGFILYTNILMQMSADNADKRIEYEYSAACCLAGLEQFDAAWEFAQKTFARAPELQNNKRASQVLADIAQHRGDNENEVKYAELHWQSVCKDTNKDKDADDSKIERAATRYAMALRNANDMQKLERFAGSVLQNASINLKQDRAFLEYLRKSAKEVLEGKIKWSVRYNTRTWPNKTDAGDWPEK